MRWRMIRKTFPTKEKLPRIGHTFVRRLSDFSIIGSVRKLFMENFFRCMWFYMKNVTMLESFNFLLYVGHNLTLKVHLTENFNISYYLMHATY